MAVPPPPGLSLEPDVRVINVLVGAMQGPPGPPGPPGGDTFTHTQDAAASTWIITHGLGRFPSVSVVDSAGSVVLGSVKYTSDSVVRIEFSAAFSGRAYLN